MGLIWFILSLAIMMTGGFIIWNLLNKVEALEDDNAFLEKWSSAATNGIISMLDTIRNIDERRWFEEDDEVGVVFTRLKEAINSLGRFLQ